MLRDLIRFNNRYNGDLIMLNYNYTQVFIIGPPAYDTSLAYRQTLMLRDVCCMV